MASRLTRKTVAQNCTRDWKSSDIDNSLRLAASNLPKNQQIAPRIRGSTCSELQGERGELHGELGLPFLRPARGGCLDGALVSLLGRHVERGLSPADRPALLADLPEVLHLGTSHFREPFLSRCHVETVASPPRPKHQFLHFRTTPLAYILTLGKHLLTLSRAGPLGTLLANPHDGGDPMKETYSVPVAAASTTSPEVSSANSTLSSTIGAGGAALSTPSTRSRTTSSATASA